MKKGKKILCGAMASLALFTGMGVLSGCDITKDKDSSANYQAKIETILTDWSDKNSHLINFSSENQELYTVSTREDNNFDTSALDLFVKYGADLTDATEFTVFGGSYNNENADENTMYYMDAEVDLLYQFSITDLNVKDIKLNQYYKLKDNDVYFKINVDDEKVRYVEIQHNNDPESPDVKYEDISIKDIYYKGDSAIKMTEMWYSHGYGTISSSYGDREINFVDYYYNEFLLSTNTEKRAFDGMVNIEDSVSSVDNGQPVNTTYIEIYSEIDGIYYISNEFTFEVQKLMIEVKENIDNNLLTLEELSKVNAIEFNVNYEEE